MQRPESIENRWDILYAEYPEVYEAFTSFPYRPTIIDQLPAIIPLRGKTIADVGSGTGGSSRALLRHASRVYGIEREQAMIRTARAVEQDGDFGQISYLCGDALALPLANASVDLVTAITLALWPYDQYRDFIREGLRAAREALIYVGIAPGWYGGDLYNVIDDPDKEDDTVDRIFLEEFGFEYRDIDSFQEYGTLENIVSTYGFIFGKQAIEHLKRKRKTSIHWRFRVYWKAM